MNKRKRNERKGWDEIKHDNGDKRKINREKEEDRKDNRILQMKLKAEESRKREKDRT